MSQHDMNLADASGASFRADANNALVALVSQSSGSSAPSATWPYMIWADTTAGVLKMRNAGDTGWIILRSLASDLVLTKTADYTATVGDFGKTILIDATSAAVTITLPALASATEGYRLAVKAINVDNAAKVDGDGSETIDGATEYTFTGADDAIEIVAGDGEWQVVSKPSTAGGVPTGALQMFAGPAGSVPSGWLLCDGSAVSRTTYAALFAVVSTVWGAGNGSTTFNLPDMRGKSPLGVNDSGLNAGESGSYSTRNEGDTGGAETHTLVESEMPGHTHGAGSFVLTGGSGGGTTGNEVGGGSGGSKPVTGTSGSAGSDGAHNNMAPFAVVNFVIKT